MTQSDVTRRGIVSGFAVGAGLAAAGSKGLIGTARAQPMPKYDITQLNVAVDKLLAVTTNRRHRFMLQAYSRHRYLEVAGRYEEIFAPDMMNKLP